MKIFDRVTGEIIIEIDSFNNADLRSADLSNADLSNADLTNANLSYADLTNAILTNADLTNADLSYADLSDADLTNANLIDADLINTILSNADLTNADLSNATLSYADLGNANLGNANLSNVNIYRTIGNMREIKSAQIERHHLVWTSKILWIGCEKYTFDEWKSFSDEKILEMDGTDGLVLWKKWKEIIFKMIEMGKSEVEK